MISGKVDTNFDTTVARDKIEKTIERRKRECLPGARWLVALKVVEGRRSFIDLLFKLQSDDGVRRELRFRTSLTGTLTTPKEQISSHPTFSLHYTILRTFVYSLCRGISRLRGCESLLEVFPTYSLAFL